MSHKIHVYLPAGETTDNAIIRLDDGRDLQGIRNLKLVIEPASPVEGQFTAYVKLHVDEATMPTAMAVTRELVENMIVEYAHQCMNSALAMEADDSETAEASDVRAANQKIRILDMLFPK